jgi:hypothetical protein
MRKGLFLCATAIVSLSVPARAAEPVSVRARFEDENRTPGVKALGWELRPSLGLRGGYEDNANRSVDRPKESAIVALRGALDARRQLGPAELAFDAAVEQEWYPSASDEDALTAQANLRGAIYAGNQLTLRGAVGVERGVEQPGSGDNGVVVLGALDPYVGRPEFVRIPIEAGAAQDFGRFFWDGAFRASLIEYSDQETEGGLTIGQGFRNGWESAAEARFGYRFSEGYGVFVRGEANRRRYDERAADNDGWKVSAGMDFELTRILTGEITAGWAEQSYAVTGQSNSAWTYGAGLTWFASPLLSLTLDASRDFRADQTIDGTGASVTTPVLRDAVSLRADLEVMRPWLVYAESSYAQSESDDGVQNNSLTRFTLGSAYMVNRYLRLNAAYDYSFAKTNNSGDIVRNGLSLAVIAAY